MLKLPQLRKSESDAFGSFFLMISTSCLDKPSEKHARLIHSYNKPDGDYQLTNLSSLSFGVSHKWGAVHHMGQLTADIDEESVINVSCELSHVSCQTDLTH